MTGELTCKGYINTFQDGVLIESKRRTPAANENVKAAGSKVQDNAAGARKIGTVTHVGTISHGAFVNFGTMTYIGNTRIGKHVC
jgi:hypothetical protein